MFKYLIIIIFLILINNVNANNKEKIIDNLKNIKNLNFEFEQNINEKVENGNCVIEYPKKIFCEYFNSNNKILVSNGKSLVIKTISSYYRYPIQKTPLNLILIIDNSYINYTIIENDNEINIFFDNQTFNLIGWQTKDLYQNLSITFLSSIRTNEVIDKNLFKLPAQN